MVLILVVVEEGLRGERGGRKGILASVLILVVVEEGLRAYKCMDKF